MNPFEALGLAYRASVGQHIVVVLAQIDNVRGAVDSVAKQAEYISDQVTVVRTSGADRVQINRGEVLFTFRKSKSVGNYQADYVLTDIPGMSDTELGRWTTLVAARAGQVIRR